MAESWLKFVLFSFADILSTLICIMVIKWLDWNIALIALGCMLLPFHVWSDILLPYSEEAFTTFQICLTVDFILVLLSFEYFGLIGPDSVPVITFQYFVFMFFIAITKCLFNLFKMIYKSIFRNGPNKFPEPRTETDVSNDETIPSSSKKRN